MLLFHKHDEIRTSKDKQMLLFHKKYGIGINTYKQALFIKHDKIRTQEANKRCYIINMIESGKIHVNKTCYYIYNRLFLGPKHIYFFKVFQRTDRQTNQQAQKHNLPVGGNYQSDRANTG